MKNLTVLASLLFAMPVSAEIYKSTVDNWVKPDGTSWVAWDIQGGSELDRAYLKGFIDTFFRRWIQLTSYKDGGDGGKKFAACMDRNARVNIAKVSKNSTFDGNTMIGEINWHVMRYQLFPTEHTIKIVIRDGACNGGDWGGCAAVDTWPIIDYAQTFEIPGWSDSPKFKIDLRQAYIQSDKSLAWAGVILHELLHNLGWRHSSYDGNVQMVSMQRCFENENYRY